MKKRHLLLSFLLSLGIFFLLPSCGGLAPTGEPGAEEPAVTASPMPTATQSLPQPIPTEGGGIPVTGGESSPVIPEKRRLTLEFPPRIRAGDADIVRLTLEVDEMGNLTPTAEFEGNVVTGETVMIENLYDTHNILAQARMTMAGIQVVPEEIISEPLLPGQPATFFWSVRPEDAGTYRGTVWLYLKFTPKAGGESRTSTISAQTLEIEATTFLGVKAGPARWMGAIGSFVSGILGMPLIDEVLKWLWKKIKK